MLCNWGYLWPPIYKGAKQVGQEGDIELLRRVPDTPSEWGKIDSKSMNSIFPSQLKEIWKSKKLFE